MYDIISPLYIVNRRLRVKSKNQISFKKVKYYILLCFYNHINILVQKESKLRIVVCEDGCGRSLTSSSMEGVSNGYGGPVGDLQRGRMQCDRSDYRHGAVDYPDCVGVGGGDGSWVVVASRAESERWSMGKRRTYEASRGNSGQENRQHCGLQHESTS